MKSLITAVSVGLIFLSSCSVYRSGQTPDDVYYSPARQAGAAYVQTDNSRNEGRRYNDAQEYSGYNDFATMDDRWLMMRVRNRNRWSAFDDYNYYSPFNTGWGYQSGLSTGFGFGSYSPYGYSNYSHFNNYWNWNSYYNPYATTIIVVNPKTNPSGYTTARNFNINSYTNTRYNKPAATRMGATPATKYNTTNSSNNNRTLGNSIRRVFSNNSTSDGYAPSSQDRPVRTYQPSSSSSSSSGSSSSGTGSGSSGGGRPSRNR